MPPKLTQAESPENRRPRSLARYFLGVGALLIALLSAVDGVALAFLIEARGQSEALSTGALPRAVAAQRLAVDASHLTVLTGELPGAASVAERQTVMERIDGLRAALAGDLDMLKKAGLKANDQVALAKAQADLLEGADAMNGVAQSAIDLESELTRQRDKGEAQAVAVLQRDIALNDQRRINLLRRQSEMAARFLALAGAQSEVAEEEMRSQQQSITAWVTRLEWGLGATLIVTVAALIRLGIVARRRRRRAEVSPTS